jgi:hypothetical protein
VSEAVAKEFWIWAIVRLLEPESDSITFFNYTSLLWMDDRLSKYQVQNYSAYNKRLLSGKNNSIDRDRSRNFNADLKQITVDSIDLVLKMLKLYS